MTRRALLLLIATIAAVPFLRAQMPHDNSQDWAKAKLEQSTRHREYVPVKAGGRTLNTLVIYPERSTKAPVVVLIHEIFGLSNWMKLQADELAAEGFIVVAPDLLSGKGADGGGTDAMGGQDNVVQAVMKLDAAEVVTDLDAVSDYGKSLPSADGKLFVAGFCWGGGKSFAFATHRKDLAAAFVFYGPPPPAADMVAISAPVYGFYGGNDNRIDATIPQTVADMKAANKFYEPVTYPDAGHGFMRAGQAPDAKPADQQAFAQGFARLLLQLRAHEHSRAHTTSHGKLTQPGLKGKGSAVAEASISRCHDTAAGM
ncbi:dienelactone hydrolase family protein [Terriglobus aquaticus]|uniref:Dienelactone hydrolase family protein n=1 Tax=Terriglobus aquaticus TaxID=940139 RepID=A0ABW9KF48_9BACT|nr:dienelactone hydrolase family protein [Terriglobus aquaticus]